MQDNIVDIVTRRPWSVANPVCVRCGYNWTSVYPTEISTTDLDCPQCGGNRLLFCTLPDLD